MATLKIWSWCLLYVQSYLEISSVTTLLQWACCQLTIYHRFVNISSRYDLFWWLIPEKIALTVLIAVFSDKIPTFHLGWMEHCLACCDAPLCAQQCTLRLIGFIWCCAKLSTWMLCFWVTHHAPYCVWLSLTSYWPVVHTCSHFCTRIRRCSMPC